MWELEAKWYEVVIRTAVIFAFIFIVLRIWGKKHLKQLAPFDFVVLLIISEGVQNAIVDDDSSITAGMITVITLVIMNSVLNRMTYFHSRIDKIVEGSPRVLVKNGIIDQEMMKKEKVTEDELHEAIRHQGVYKVEDVGLAIIETNGQVSVIRKEDTGFIQGEIQ